MPPEVTQALNEAQAASLVTGELNAQENDTTTTIKAYK
jgi:hypothetical protein